MKKIQIEYDSKNYQIEVYFETSFPIGYYKISWDNIDLLKIIPSPVFLSCNKEGGISIPHVNNIEQLTLLTSIVSGILLNEMLSAKI